MFSKIAGSDVTLTTYPLLVRDIENLKDIAWSGLILDEAQAIKNPDSIACKSARMLQSDYRLCLSGTPVENHLGELWSLFQFLMPGILGDRSSFRKKFRTPIENNGNTTKQLILATRLRPFMLRRTKESVVRELPPKTEIIRRIELEGDQRDLYETVRLAMHEKVREEIAAKGIITSRIVILNVLLKLRQACCDPRLVKLP